MRMAIQCICMTYFLEQKMTRSNTTQMWFGNEGNLVCRKCNRTFTRKSYLVNHMQLHTGLFKYFCELCKKGYNGMTAYNVHMDRHRGVKYQCDFCAKTFTSLQMRDYHTSVHTGNYRFHCDFCNKGFNVKSFCEKHIASHV